MVEANPAAGEVTGAAPDGARVTVVHARINRERGRFLRTDLTGETVYSPVALAELVTEILTEHTTPPAGTPPVADLLVALGQVRAQRAALWQLLKDRVRAVIVTCQHNSDLHLENTGLRQELRAVQAERDKLARLARVRENDVLDVICERDQLAARLDELLDTATATAGGR
jgi:hypothetical protein